MSDYASYEEILPLLDRPKKTGAWIMSFCPSHQDKIRSLGLSEKGVLECMTGCSFKDVIASLRKSGGAQARPTTGSGASPSPSTPPRRIGVSRTSVKTPSPSSLPSAAPTDVRPTVSTDDWCQVDMYQYRTQAGELVAEKSRWHNLSQVTAEGKPQKKFLWRLPGATGWTGLAGKLTTKDLPLFGIERLAQ